MAKLVDLSNELLLIIVSYLATGDDIDTKTLFNLCRTSRVFLDIAQPALYTCVRIAEPTPDPLKPLKIFLQTLLERPSLAKSTQKLALINDRGIRYEWPVLQNDPYFMGLSSLIGSRSSEIEPDLCYYPLASEVLARLPNLQHLRFTAEIEPPRSLLERIHQLQAETSILSKLKTFHLYVTPMTPSSHIPFTNSANTILFLIFRHKRYEDGPVNIKDYIPFLQYPSFEEFSTDSDVPDLLGNSRANNTLTPSTVELLWCIGPLPTMERLLNACSCLTLFDFVVPASSRYRSMSDVGYDPLVAPRELVAILLETHGSTLTTLRLDFHHFYSLRDPELQEELEGQSLAHCDFTYPSLRDFENLTRMTIEFEKLVKVGDLPASLELLNLDYCHFADLDKEYLNELVRLKETWCPVIKYVTVSGWEKTNEGITTVREHARLLDVPVQVPTDERVLTFLGAANHLQIQSRELLFFDISDYEDNMETDEDEEVTPTLE
jgi:hypothetical protein